MSTRLKLILVLFFLIQLGIFAWVYADNKAIYIPYETYLENPLAVDSMDLSGLEIDELIDEMSQFENVTYIDLSDNNFTEIPKILFELQELRTLKMSNNQLKKVTIYENDIIRTLDLSHNKLEKLDEIWKLKGLQKIDLSYNQFTEMVDFTHTFIQQILFSNNQLKHFYNIEADLPLRGKVKYLDLAANVKEVATEIPSYIYSDLSNFDQCKRLNLSNNYFESFPDVLFDNNDLTYLDLSNCHFGKYNFLSFNSSNIVSLNLTDSNLQLELSMLDSFPKLRVLNLSKINFPTFNYKNEKLKQLIINDINIKGAFYLDLPKLEKLEIDYRYAEQLLAFNLPNLRSINIKNYPKDSDLKAQLKAKFPRIGIIKEAVEEEAF